MLFICHVFGKSTKMASIANDQYVSQLSNALIIKGSICTQENFVRTKKSLNKKNSLKIKVVHGGSQCKEILSVQGKFPECKLALKVVNCIS